MKEAYTRVEKRIVSETAACEPLRKNNHDPGGENIFITRSENLT
jgi:hypothetical protein